MTTTPVITITPCVSSQINGFGYDPVSRTLAVQFPGKGVMPGSIYHYADVPPEVFAEFQASDSKGKFFGSRIRSVFAYEKQPDANGIVFGLTQAQEPKYTTGTKDGRLTNRATGKPIPDDEPVFILRAKDVNALPVLRDYMLLLENSEHIASVYKRIAAFEAFAAAHPERMTTPDTTAA